MKKLYLQGSAMKTNTDLALMPVNYEIQPARGISSRGVDHYSAERGNLIRIPFAGSKSSRVGNTYSRIGNEKEKTGMGENIDLYV